ncbi:hypothetical protein [Leifsonia sp. AG29]|uniref:hypothetical protein n=1 Tax=Leifsonia sp. AG29 TaxID=2598860 RepID=UPI001E5AAE49|nr:hypothetical protein [Leifsonia sp. AG29]
MTALAEARRLLARMTGRAAITWWTWLITLPFALTVMSGVQYVHGGAAEVLAVAAFEHAVFGVLLAAGWWLLRVTPPRARPAVALAALATAGALRPFAFLWAGAILEIPVEAGDLPGRIVINVVTVTAACALIAAGVDLVREHRAVFGRLRSARAAAERDAECAAERLRLLRRTAVDDVLAEIERVAEPEGRPLDPDAAARVLRGLAERVVRPASHRVYDQEQALEPRPPRALEVRARDWIAAVVGATRAASPLPLALLFAALTLPYAVLAYGVVVSVPALAAGIAVTVAGNALVARIGPVDGPARWLFTLSLGYAAVGLALATTGQLVLTALGRVPDLVWFEAAMYPLVALSVVFVVSLSRRTRRDQGDLEAAVQASVDAAARARADFEHERASLARLLHSGVQSELIASALALGAAGGGDASAELRAVVERIRAELLRRPESAEPEARIRTLLDSWSSAIPLRVRIGDGVWERLLVPSRCEAVVDTVSEGLANAVRHGDGSPVALELRAAGRDGVEVVVASGGRLGGARPGIGLRQLSERGSVALREAAGRVELAVAIP